LFVVAGHQSANIERHTFFQCVRARSPRRNPTARARAFSQSGMGLPRFRDFTLHDESSPAQPFQPEEP